MRYIIVTVFAALLAWSSGAGEAVAQAVGKVVAVTQGAELRSGGSRVRLTRGGGFAMGDTIVTDAAGSAQLLFTDGTKIVVGPGSSLVIEEILMQSGGRAERFAVTAVGGTFRFITGKSAKPAYRISTPTATMGIRGTAFDFSVNSGAGTNLVLFRGEVALCRQNGSGCSQIRGSCTMAISDRQGRTVGAQSLEQKSSVIQAEFPFIVDQAPLERAFRAPTRACNDAVALFRPLRQTRERGDNGSDGPSERNGEPPSR